MNVNRHPTLMLNASYEPLRIVSLKKALTLLSKGVAVVEVPTNILVHRGLGIYAPSVIRLQFYHHVPTKLPIVSRKNIFVRDGYRCMYCGTRHVGGDLELEHIIPKSRGGRNAWENLVAACRKCNAKKDNRTPEEAGMQLIRRPLPANIHTPRFILKSLAAEVQEWNRFLYRDSEGEKRLQFRALEA